MLRPPVILDPLRVLVVDALGSGADQTYVRAMLQPAWEAACRAVTSIAGWQFSIVNAGSETALIQAVEQHRPNVLWMNAHGSWMKERNAAGILLEEEFSLLTELAPPPVVLLSSCETTPRAASPVSVVEMLLRNHARAVIGTMVPVRAQHNALLMARLFGELVDNVKRPRFRNFSELWSHIATSNAYLDITMASEKVMRWSFTGGDQRPEYRFKKELSSGRLRGSHVYEDSVTILTELADATGFGKTFRATMNSPGYVPETLFYGLFGWPGRVLVPGALTDASMGRVTNAS